jgi:U3 small nucleolar RNA-associated protein 22
MSKPSLKRSAPSLAKSPRSNKHQKPSMSDKEEDVEEFNDFVDQLTDDEEEGDEHDSDEEDEMHMTRNAGKTAAGSEDERDEDDEESDEDSEVNEFELEGSEGDNGFDDGEDLMANLENAAEDNDDDDEEENEDEEEEVMAPVRLVKKANVRNSRAAVPLKPAELRALAFAELTASPISTIIATQVNAFLTPITPPTPATSPLQPLLKSIHAHFTNLADVAPISIEALRKQGRIIPGEKGGKWDKVELAWTRPRGEEIRICSSWAWGGSSKNSKGEYIVEMAIGIPVVRLVLRHSTYSLLACSYLNMPTVIVTAKRLFVPSIPH